MASRASSRERNRSQQQCRSPKPLDATPSTPTASRKPSARPSFLETVSATRAFIGETLDEKRLRRAARIKELEHRCRKLERMLDGINPFCGDDTWMRQRESLERRIAETEKERFSVEIDLLEDPLERELFELKKRLRMLGEEAGSDG